MSQEVVVISGLMVIALLALMAAIARLYRKAGPHEAIIVYGFRGTRIVKGGGGGGVLATAGGLVFAGDASGNLIAHDAATGKPVWHTRIGEVTNPPQTYMLDGHQYVIAATGDMLWSFMLY